MKEKENLPQLRQFIVTYFNESELRDLSFDLQIDYEGLPGPSKADKARELVDHMWRHDRLDVLIETVSQLRPDSSPLVEEKTKKSDAFNNANDLRRHQMYLNRQDIFWIPFNKRVTQKFWVCGTSLVGVVERGLIQEYFESQIRDIKVILPSTEEAFISYEQLEKYDKLAENALVANQVKLARASYQNLKAIISRYVPSPEKYLKQYTGIMYSNITIFDDDAFISFYDSIGSGESSFALHFNRNSNDQGYRKIEEEFLRMWDADSDFGTKSKKKRGTSIIFLNNKDQILLFLRDDKKTIPFPNTWDVLGGHVEDRETPVETIVREIDEEMEIILDNPKLFNVYDLVDRIEHTFWQRANFDIAQIVLHEGQRLRWFTEGEIERMTDEELAFGFRHILMDFFNKKPFI